MPEPATGGCPQQRYTSQIFAGDSLRPAAISLDGVPPARLAATARPASQLLDPSYRLRLASRHCASRCLAAPPDPKQLGPQDSCFLARSIACLALLEIAVKASLPPRSAH